MTEHSWEDVVALFERALDLSPEEREPFLAPLDPALRERVAAMLRADSTDHPLLDAPSGSVRSVVGRTTSPGIAAGARIGSYAVVRELGRGGMATVYLAEDPRHNRSVAVKLLHVDASIEWAALLRDAVRGWRDVAGADRASGSVTAR
jgi:eukaryotic-like serine/threonine-protein kinase